MNRIFTYPSIQVPSVMDDPNVNGSFDHHKIERINKGIDALVKSVTASRKGVK